MTTIDHRILIPAPPQVVWEYISTISRNPKWQVDCQSIAFLTEKHEGPGTRWRCTTAKGHEHVLEITAWYNGLGYEYVYIDGPRYEENRGRLRLQEIPEGTIVQWTFTYTLGGLFGGMRDTLGKRREIDSTMADSLRKLYTQLKTQSALSTTPQGESKALIREAPDVEARANYQPRHPSMMQERFDAEKTVPTASMQKAPPVFDEPPIADDDGQPLHGIVLPEPLVAEDDTRPNPVIKREPAPADDIPAGDEPEFLTELDRMEAEADEAAVADAEVERKDDVSAAAPAPAPEPEPEPAREVPPPEIARFMPPVEQTRRVEPNAEETRAANMRELVEIAPVAPDDAPSAPAAAETPAEAVEAPADAPAETTEAEAGQPNEAAAPAEPVASQAAAPVEETRATQKPDALPPLPPAAEPDATRLIDFSVPEPEAEAKPADAQPESAAEQDQAAEQPEAQAEAEPASETPPAPEPKPWEEATVSTSRLMSEPGKMDTATMSIWEIFGVQRPSETQELKAIVVPAKVEQQGNIPSVRMGLRMALRRKLVNVRRP